MHLQDYGTNILSSNFIKFVNSFLAGNDNNRFWLNHSHQINNLKFESNLEGLINLRKGCQSNLFIAYLNINSLRKKIISLRQILKKTKIDVLYINETKLDSSFPNHQFKIEGYQFPPLRRDQNSKRGGKMGGFLRRFYCKANELLWNEKRWNHTSWTYIPVKDNESMDMRLVKTSSD